MLFHAIGVKRIGKFRMWRPEKIISGGQTGADIGGLVGAERCTIDTGGCAPRDFKTENGPQPLLATRFGLIAHPSPNYHDRTKENVEKADATLVFATNASSAGTKLTVELCEQLKKPWALLDPYSTTVVQTASAFIDQVKTTVLNIAGHRESVSPGIAKQVAFTVAAIFSTLPEQPQHPKKVT